MDTCVDFESRLFAPFLSEEGQVNPQVYGAELAWWLSRELAQEGVETSIRLMLLETLGQIQSISTPDFLWGKEIIIRGRKNGGLAPGGHDGFGNGTAGWLAHPSRGSTNHVAPRLGCTVSSC